MDFSLCNELLQTAERDWAETCHLTAQIGYRSIEVAPFTLGEDVRQISHHARHVYAQTAERAGLKVVGLHWLLVSPPDLSLTSADPGTRAATTDYLLALVDFCADLGGRIMVLGSPNQRRIPEGGSRQQAVDRLIACLEPALARAVTRQVTLCLEPLPTPESNFVLTLAEATAILNRLSHPNLRTIFDAKSASSEGIDPGQLIRTYAGQIAHVHANDANRRGPGYGDTDFVPILHELLKVGYNGSVSVEVFDTSPDPVTVAGESLAYLQRCLERAQE